jgi:two-component system, cell cycle response regulator
MKSADSNKAPAPRLITNTTLAVRIALAIAGTEMFVSLLLWLTHADYSPIVEALLHTFLLIVISTPLIYFWAIKPFSGDRDKVIHELDHLANSDALTGLGNRRLLSEKLESFIENRHRVNARGALLLLDLDGFKQVNDTHGHRLGDALLVEVAKRLRNFATANDVLARLGGDEFCLLSFDMPSDKHEAQDKAQHLADMLVAAVQSPYLIEGKTIRIGASVGVRVLGFRTLKPETAVHQADMPMYKAKQSGGGQAVVFAESALMSKPMDEDSKPI